MSRQDMKGRFNAFALRVVRLVAALPQGRVGDVLWRQLLKSGTSIGANFREAQRASSKRHFVTILEIALREADETLYWLELLQAASVIKPQRLEEIVRECDELVAILISSVRSAKRHRPPE